MQNLESRHHNYKSMVSKKWSGISIYRIRKNFVKSPLSKFPIYILGTNHTRFEKVWCVLVVDILCRNDYCARKTGQECRLCVMQVPSRRETLAIMRWSYQRCPRKNYRRYSLQAAGNSLLGGSHENCWWHASPNVAIRVGFLNWLA